MSDHFSEQVLRYHKAGKEPHWIANRLLCGLLAVEGVLARKEEVQAYMDNKREEKNKAEQEQNFQEVPPTNKEKIEQELIIASSLLAEASKSILSVVHALNDRQPTEEEFLEYLLSKVQGNTESNPYEFLTDSLLADYIIIKRK